MEDNIIFHIENLNLHYGEKHALKNVSIDILKIKSQLLSVLLAVVNPPCLDV